MIQIAVGLPASARKLLAPRLRPARAATAAVGRHLVTSAPARAQAHRPAIRVRFRRARSAPACRARRQVQRLPAGFRNRCVARSRGLRMVALASSMPWRASAARLPSPTTASVDRRPASLRAARKGGVDRIRADEGHQRVARQVGQRCRKRRLVRQRHDLQQGKDTTARAQRRRRRCASALACASGRVMTTGFRHPVWQAARMRGGILRLQHAATCRPSVSGALGRAAASARGDALAIRRGDHRAQAHGGAVDGGVSRQRNLAAAAEIRATPCARPSPRCAVARG